MENTKIRTIRITILDNSLMVDARCCDGDVVNGIFAFHSDEKAFEKLREMIATRRVDISEQAAEQLQWKARAVGSVGNYVSAADPDPNGFRAMASELGIDPEDLKKGMKLGFDEMAEAAEERDRWKSGDQ